MLEVEQIEKSYPQADGSMTTVLEKVSLNVKDGEFFTLLGPSGCGKTTTLRSVAGLERPDQGRISVNGEDFYNSGRNVYVPAKSRRIGMVFQSYAVWPHMDVFDNVAFPLKVVRPRISTDEIKRKVRRVLETVHLAEYEHRPATKLSGGQQQRLAMARALVMEPRVLLLDEPLSNLDALLRETMRLELRRLQREAGITTIYVTHDQVEALALSDRLAVMNKGKIVQIDNPLELYHRPKDSFVAGFIGVSNLLPAIAKADIRPGETGPVEWQGQTLLATMPGGSTKGAEMVVSIRPESVEVTEMSETSTETGGAGETTNVLIGTVAESQFLGNLTDVLVRAGNEELRVYGSPDRVVPVGSKVKMEVQHGACLALAKD